MVLNDLNGFKWFNQLIHYLGPKWHEWLLFTIQTMSKWTKWAFMRTKALPCCLFSAHNKEKIVEVMVILYPRGGRSSGARLALTWSRVGWHFVKMLMLSYISLELYHTCLPLWFKLRTLVCNLSKYFELNLKCHVIRFCHDPIIQRKKFQGHTLTSECVQQEVSHTHTHTHTHTCVPCGIKLTYKPINSLHHLMMIHTHWSFLENLIYFNKH
jgi:hypothetical protein